MEMKTSSSRRSSGPVLRSFSPSGSGRFHNSYSAGCVSSSSSSSSAFASSTSSSFHSPASAFFNHHDRNNHHVNHHRSASPTRVNLYTSNCAPSFRFSIDRYISVKKQNNPISFEKKACMCSPTTHPGSFRCSLHKNAGLSNQGSGSASYPSNRLNMRRSAMTNSVVRIGGVEGEWLKRSLRDLIRPSSHHQRRREGFQRRPSRLSIMSKAEDL